jgi:RHS repeat-associated protein
MTTEQKYYAHTFFVVNLTLIFYHKKLCRYTLFGETLLDITATNGNYDEPYKFGGKITDQESGLMYFEDRYYWDKGSIPISTDRHWFNSPQFSSYVWCANDPINVADPTGMDTVSANEIWNYSTADYHTSGTYGIHNEETNFQTKPNKDGEYFTLHEMQSGENAGNYLAIAHYGEDENGYDIYEYKYMVGKDKVTDFLNGKQSPTGRVQNLLELANFLGTEYDSSKSTFQNLMANWWKCVTDPFNYLPTPSMKIKPKTWNTFLKNTKGRYNKSTFNQRSVDYQQWKQKKTIEIGR